MSDLFVRFFEAIKLMRSDERGATAVEYGLLVALIAAIIIGVVMTLGEEIGNAFQSIVDQL